MPRFVGIYICASRKNGQAEAILPDTEDDLEKWLEINTKYSVEWPNITTSREPPADADDFKGKQGKFEEHFSPEPGQGD